jgi:peptidyl-prolyl cis-trans isomerase D
MAILNKIRQRSLFLILVIAMALFAFVLADVFKNSDGFSTADQNLLATINGIDIERDDFEKEFQNQIRRQNSDKYKGPKLSDKQIRDNVWSVELRSVILKNQFNRIGIFVEKNQMRSLIKNFSFNEFKNEDGLFDENKLNEFIANLKEISPLKYPFNGGEINYNDWNNIESDLAQNALDNSYSNMISSGLRSTLFDGKTNYHFQNDNADIKFVYFPYSSIPDSLTSVSNADLTAYIKGNSKKYSVEKSRDLVYVKFDASPSVKDEKDIADNLSKLIIDREEYSEKVLGFKNTADPESFLNRYSDIKLSNSYVFENAFDIENSSKIFNLKPGDLYGPYKEKGFMKITKLLDTKMISDSTEVRHILISYTGLGMSNLNEEPITRTEAQAKTTADSIYRLVKRNRNNFKKVLDLSSDTPSIQRGGIRKFPYNAQGFGDKFKVFSFESKVGEISVIESNLGFHVVEILSQNKKRKAVKVADLGLKIEPSSGTLDSVYNSANKFQELASKSDFRVVAKENNYTLKTTNKIKELDENIPSLGAQRDLIKWLYNERTDVGDFKEYDLKNGSIVVAMLASINKAGLISNENAPLSAIAAIKNNKKADLILKKIKGKTLPQISENQNQKIQTALAVNISSPTLSGVGNEPEVIGSSFGLEEGQTSKAILGNKGVFYIYLEKLNIAPDLPNYLMFSNNLSAAKINNLKTKIYEALKEVSEIVDNRALFY